MEQAIDNGSQVSTFNIQSSTFSLQSRHMTHSEPANANANLTHDRTTSAGAVPLVDNLEPDVKLTTMMWSSSNSAISSICQVKQICGRVDVWSRYDRSVHTACIRHVDSSVCVTEMMISSFLRNAWVLITFQKKILTKGSS